MVALILLVIIAAASSFVGSKLGPGIHGTTISGLKLSFVFWSAVLGAAIGALLGLLGLGVGLAGLFVAHAALLGLTSGLVGCGAGYLLTRRA